MRLLEKDDCTSSHGNAFYLYPSAFGAWDALYSLETPSAGIAGRLWLNEDYHALHATCLCGVSTAGLRLFVGI